METNQISMMNQKLNFFGIIKETLKLIPTNPKLILLTFLTSFPYFCFLLFLETSFQQTFITAIKSKLEPPDYESFEGIRFYIQPTPISVLVKLIKDVFLPFLLPGFLCLGIVHLLHLLNTIATVHSASMIYAGEGTVHLKEFLCRPFREVGLKGPLITSIYALVLASLASIGIVSLSTHLFIGESFLFKAVVGSVIIALLVKYLEWSAIWNMGMVISILEKKHGDVAIGVSAYISRGSRKRGFVLMLVFFSWWVALRLTCIHGMWTKSKNLFMVSVTEVLFICLGNVVKWVAFTVYFYDCKKRFLEKKVDVEQGRATESVKL